MTRLPAGHDGCPHHDAQRLEGPAGPGPLASRLPLSRRVTAARRRLAPICASDLVRGKLETDGRPRRRSAPEGEPGARPSIRCRPSSARYPVVTDRGTTHLKHARDRHSPSRVVVGMSHYRPVRMLRTWAQRPQMEGSKDPFLRGEGRCRECLSRLKKSWVTGPLAVGSWSYRLRHTTPAIAIRRKIAERAHFQSRRISNTGAANFFYRSDQVGRSDQIRGSSWSSAATTAKSSRSRS